MSAITPDAIQVHSIENIPLLRCKRIAKMQLEVR